MSYALKDVKLDSEKFNSYETGFTAEDDTNDKIIKGLSKANIFIGANNTGKSRFMREFLSKYDYEYNNPSLDLYEINNIIEELKSAIIMSWDGEYLNNPVDNDNLFGYCDIDLSNTISNDTQIFDFFKMLKRLYNLKNQKFISINKFLPKKIKSVLNENLALYVKGLSEWSYKRLWVTNFAGYSVIKSTHDLEVIQGKIIDAINKIENLEVKGSIQQKYIPILRGLRPLCIGHENECSGSGFNLYHNRTKNDYWKNEKPEEFEIFTGLDLYEKVKRLLLGKKADRDKISKFQDFLSENFFDGADITITPNIDDDVLYIKIGDEQEFPVYQLGDGIQSIIILTFPMFENMGSDKNILMGIEEPELYLHPGMHRKFIEVLYDKRFDNFQFFITTHSNHLLDLMQEREEMTIYKFSKKLEGEGAEKDAKFNIATSTSDDREVLELLGVRNSSVFLSNCTIWVEGVTDRMYLRKYMEIWQKNNSGKTYEEGLHYSFIEYGGSNITHWSFLDEEGEESQNIDYKVISNNVFVIIDGDYAKDGSDNSKKESRIDKLRSKLNDHCYRLEGNEIENTLSPDTIKKIIKEKSGLEEIDFEVKHPAYKKKYLGKYLDGLVEGKKNRKYKYSSSSGTINYKTDFAKTAIKNIESFEDLSDEAKTLCEKLYEFIRKANC